MFIWFLVALVGGYGLGASTEAFSGVMNLVLLMIALHAIHVEFELQETMRKFRASSETPRGCPCDKQE